MAQSRTDEESPLLRHNEEDEIPTSEEHPTFFDRLAELAQEPLSPLSKLLLITSLLFLLSSSIFVGLFAGAQHRINSGKGNAPSEPHTFLETHTHTESFTLISTVTTTAPVTVTAPPPKPTNEPNEQPCLTPQCIVLSASILSSLDTSKDPCEDFYEYANGGWLDSHPIPGDKPAMSQAKELSIENERIIKSIFNERDDDLSLPDKETFAKLTNFYHSCLDERQLDETGTAPLLRVVKAIKDIFNSSKSIETGPQDASGQQPFHKTRQELPPGLTSALAFVHARGINALFSFQIEGDVGVDPNQLMLWFHQPDLGLLAKEYYEEEPIVTIYTSVLEKLLYTLDEGEEKPAAWPPWPWPPWGGDDDDKGGHKENKSEKARRQAKEVVEFETELARAGADLDILWEDPVATYNVIPFSNLTDSLPAIDFLSYISSLSHHETPTDIILTHPPYVTALANLLDTTSASTVEAYIIVRTALTLAPYLGTGTSTWKAVRELEEKLKGLKKGAVTDRSEWCVAQVTGSLGYAAGRFFIPKVGDVREQGTQVIKNVVAAFEAYLPSVRWMDNESAKAAREKAEAIRIKVGYPLSPNTMLDSAIAEYYHVVKVDPKRFFENVISAAASAKAKMWQKLGGKRDPEEWEMVPTTVDAYFNPPANEIVFPAGILRTPFFSPDWPTYLNYGAFGFVAAHELTHAFDSAGRLYNQEGRLAPWWSNSTSEGFEVVRDCIAKQYSEYTVDDGHGGKVHLNGNLTSGENIGDSGFIFAYRAWKAQYDTSYQAGKEYILPGIKHTREQLFFIALARVFATNIKPEAALQKVRTDPHSPARYRVEGSLRNVPEFAAAFNCSKTAKLNPPDEKRCRLW